VYSDLFIVIQYDRELHKSPGASSEFRKLFFLSTWSVSFDIKKSIDFHASVNSCSSSYQTVSAQVKSSPPVTRNTPPLSIHNKLLVSTFSSVPIWAHFQTEWELYSPTYLLHVVNTSACRSKVFYFSTCNSSKFLLPFDRTTSQHTVMRPKHWLAASHGQWIHTLRVERGDIADCIGTENVKLRYKYEVKQEYVD
jgi:hypothetical protein